MPRKSLIYRVWKGSLHRHHIRDRVMDQTLTKGSLRLIRLDSAGFGYVKAC